MLPALYVLARLDNTMTTDGNASASIRWDDHVGLQAKAGEPTALHFAIAVLVVVVRITPALGHLGVIARAGRA
jgi:hypothetical protein